MRGTARPSSRACAAALSARGVVVVQDAAEAEFSGMPTHTIAGDHPDRVLPLAEIAPAVTRLLAHLSPEADVSKNDNDEMSVETSYALLDREMIERAQPPGAPSAFSCPACGGVLWELEDENGGDLLRFRCRVGHAYTAESARRPVRAGATDRGPLRAALERGPPAGGADPHRSPRA